MTLGQIRRAMFRDEEEYQLHLAYAEAVCRFVKRRSADLIAFYMAKATLVFGCSAISELEIAERGRCTVRTARKVIIEMIENGFLHYDGHDDFGNPVYCALWDRAEDHMAWSRRYDAEYEMAGRSGKPWTPPPYPAWQRERKKYVVGDLLRTREESCVA